MDNPNIIARLYPLSRFPIKQGPRRARSGVSYIDITFAEAVRPSRGFVVGSDAGCDVVVPLSQKAKLSSRHFSLAFDKGGRLIVQDLGSRSGTIVSYDGQGEEIRRNFCWIVSDFGDLLKVNEIQIHVSNEVSFRLEVPSPSWEYHIRARDLMEAVQNPKRFDEPERSQGNLVPSRLDTGPIFIKTVLGEGGHGIAYHCWNVSTGDAHVVKQARMEDLKRGAAFSMLEFSTSTSTPFNWVKPEANLMELVSHVRTTTPTTTRALMLTLN